MKKIRLLILIMISSLLSQAQTIIDPKLNETMSCCTDNEPIEVVVLMKAQYDRSQLSRQMEFLTTKSMRREFVIKELKAFAEAS